VLFAVIGLLRPPGDLANDVTFIEPDENTRQELRQAGRDVNKALAESGKAKVPILDTDDDNTFFGLDKDLNLTLKWNGEEMSVPPQIRKRWDHFRKLSREDKAEQLYAGVLRYGPYAMVALLPAFALLLKLAYLGRGTRYPGRPRRYAEHLVYSAHLHAFAALMIIALLLVPSGIVRVAIVLWILFYAMRARQVVYRGRWWAGLLRALAIAVVYMMLASVAILGLLAAAIMMR